MLRPSITKPYAVRSERWVEVTGDNYSATRRMLSAVDEHREVVALLGSGHEGLDRSGYLVDEGRGCLKV